ncbi:MAG: sulfite exporter TauE/SafE family protein [Gemmatimonadota bacterium]
MILQDLSAKDVLLIALGAFAVFYLVALAKGVMRTRHAGSTSADAATPSVGTTATGFVANFFDTLGVGSFATTTAIFRQWRMVRDEFIPGTLNAGHTFPTIVQAFIFTRLVPVDSTTLILMIVAAVAGAWLGAGIVARWPRRAIQIGMGIALLAAAGLMLLAQFKLIPAGGTAHGLTGTLLWAGVAGNFILGTLMTLGIGLYGPCLILVSLLGMDPIAAFPIMMGSCAFLMPVASARFIKADKYHPGATIGLMLGGIPAVLIAAYIVKSLPLTVIRYLVVVVVVYTSVSLLRAARHPSRVNELEGGAKEVAAS